MAISNLKIGNTLLTIDEIQNSIHSNHKGKADDYLGLKDWGPLEKTMHLKGKLLYENYFSKTSDILGLDC